MSTTVIGRNDIGLTLETINENGIIDPNQGIVAVAVGISPIVDLPGTFNVQEALQSLSTGGGSGGVSPVDLASTAAGKGASMVGIQDAAARYTGVTVEAALVEAATVAILAATTVGKGASTVGIEDTGTHYTGTTVETVLAEAAVATNAAQSDATQALSDAADAQADANTALAAQVAVTAEEKFLARFKSLSPTGYPMFTFDDMDNAIANEIAINGVWDPLNGATKSKVHAHAGLCTGTGLASAVVFSKQRIAALAGTSDTALSGSSKKWLLGGIAIFADAIDVLDDRRAFTLAASFTTNFIGVGVFAEVSTTKFVFRLVKGGVDVSALSTVNFSTGSHFLELWSDGVNVFGSVDHETPVTVGLVSDIATGTLSEYHGVLSGTTTMYIDAACLAGERL